MCRVLMKSPKTSFSNKDSYQIMMGIIISPKFKIIDIDNLDMPKINYQAL